MFLKRLCLISLSGLITGMPAPQVNGEVFLLVSDYPAGHEW
ncbi:hypothetical protein AXX16_1093 [Serratia rubidaea]|nr:hypothetical protein AXX16_1093 [Serratia rubidaea]